MKSIKIGSTAVGTILDSPCGPGAPCRAKLEAMEVAHQRALQELQEKHEREIRELEDQKGRLIQEEIQSAAKGKVLWNQNWDKAVASLPQVEYVLTVDFLYDFNVFIFVTAFAMF